MKRARAVDHVGTTAPDADPAIERLLVEAQTVRPRSLAPRERRVELLVAFAFLAAAIALAVAAPYSRSFDWPLAAGLVVAYAIAARVRFHTGAYWTTPTQLIFVPMLFLLPTAA